MLEVDLFQHQQQIQLAHLLAQSCLCGSPKTLIFHPFSINGPPPTAILHGRISVNIHSRARCTSSHTPIRLLLPKIPATARSLRGWRRFLPCLRRHHPPFPCTALQSHTAQILPAQQPTQQHQRRDGSLRSIKHCHDKCC